MEDEVHSFKHSCGFGRVMQVKKPRFQPVLTGECDDIRASARKYRLQATFDRAIDDEAPGVSIGMLKEYLIFKFNGI